MSKVVESIRRHYRSWLARDDVHVWAEIDEDGPVATIEQVASDDWVTVVQHCVPPLNPQWTVRARLISDGDVIAESSDGWTKDDGATWSFRFYKPPLMERQTVHIQYVLLTEAGWQVGSFKKSDGQ